MATEADKIAKAIDRNTTAIFNFNANFVEAFNLWKEMQEKNAEEVSDKKD